MKPLPMRMIITGILNTKTFVYESDNNWEGKPLFMRVIITGRKTFVYESDNNWKENLCL